jgi:hypothetical protein
MLGRSVKLAFHSTALILVATFTLGFMLALHAKVFGIPLILILTSWLTKYCFVLLDTGLFGNTEPPVLSVEMVNPVSEARPFALCFWIASFVALAIGAWNYAGAGLAFVVGGIGIFLIPAIIGSLGLSSNVFLASLPNRWLHVMWTLGLDYLLITFIMLASAGILYCLISIEAPSWVGMSVEELLLLFIFSCVGSALFERRAVLGLESRSQDEHREERRQREHIRGRQRAMDHAYEQFRHNKPQEGWREVERWLTQHAHGQQRLIEYYAVLKAASAWDDPRPADRLANDLIAILLVQRETGAALEVAEARFASNPLFRATAAVRLAELAGLAGKRALRRQLAGPAS